MNKKLYKRIDIWKRISKEKVARYICYEILGKKEFCVQQVDFFYYPVNKSQLERSELQAVELLLDTPPEERAEKVFSSLAEAIQAHDEEFL